MFTLLWHAAVFMTITLVVYLICTQVFVKMEDRKRERHAARRR
ncbi:MAG TPA: hypothetical protein VFL93_10650 [Longimicrobiaceae bacterium]|nr:hypothetical protein [Longimicrobiaceae bacterium]